MKILVMHNTHRSGSVSGDDLSTAMEIELLRKHGHRVITMTPSNDEFDGSGMAGKVETALQIPWSFTSFRRARKIIAEEHPDLVHVHNIFPLLSPSVYYAAREGRVPVIQSLHDFRLLCPAAFCFRKGHVCEECVKGSCLPGVCHGCFEHSALRTLPIALMLNMHRMFNTFKHAIDGYIAITEWQRSVFLREGFKAEKLFLKPNFTEDTCGTEVQPTGSHALYLGRLGPEKGLDALIEAWRGLPDIPLRLIGDGPERGRCESLVQTLVMKNVHFAGAMAHTECTAALGTARFTIVPSLWYEGCPRTIIEAFSRGKPVVASNMGAMADMVKDGYTGLLFPPGDAKALRDKAEWLWNNPEECVRMGLNARREYLDKYSPEKNYQILMGIYEAILSRTVKERAGNSRGRTLPFRRSADKGRL